MSPFSFPRTLRAARPWIAAAMLLAGWLTATPARCTLGPRAAPPAVSIYANPAWPWLQLLWAGLPWGAGSSQDLRAAREPHPGARAVGRHGPASAGATTPDTGGTSDAGSGGAGCQTDPNGRCSSPPPP